MAPDPAPLRIAQLANFVGPVTGGMRVAIDKLAEGYVAAGHERLLVVPGPEDTYEQTALGTVATVASPRISDEYRMVAQPWKVLRLLERFGPTSIEVSDKWTMTPAARWARRHGVGSALFSHERLDDMLAGFLQVRRGVAPVIHAMNRRLARMYDTVVITSDYSAGEWADSGADADLVKVPLGVDLETFHPQRGAPTEDGWLKLCYIGRLSREKSPQLAIAAAAEVHRRGVPMRMDVYGTGPHLALMKQAAGDAPVHFHGHVASRTKIAEHFAMADVSLSVCPSETFGLAVLEALACGTPVVTADRGGARELVDDTCGAWGAPEVGVLADAIERVAARQDDVRTQARQRAERYTWAHSVERMLQLHARLAASR